MVLKSIGYLIALYVAMFVIALGFGLGTSAALGTIALAAGIGTTVAVVAIIVGVSLEVVYGIPRLPAQIVCAALAVASTALTVFYA